MPALPPYRFKWNPLPGYVCCRQRLLMQRTLLLAGMGCALLLITESGSANNNQRSEHPDLNYGSYEASVHRCRLDRNGMLRSCNTMQLAQRGDTGLRIRFTGAGKEPGTTIRYTFITKNPEGIKPLKCDQGDCQPLAHPWIAEVISASTAQFNARGLPVSLPQARAMQGDCQLSKRQISCNSRTKDDGLKLSAEAHL